MNHSFDVEIATKYGVNAAILLQNIQFWCAKNRANGVNYHDGLYWTFNSRKAFTELFPYMSTKQIKSAIDLLVKDGLVVVGNYNEDGRDRTLWYAVTEKADCICQNGNSCNAKMSNAHAENVKPLPDIKQTDINTDIIKNPSDSCAEPEKSASAPDEQAVLTLPLNDGSEHPIMQRDVDKYKQLYPAVDIMQELRKMCGWCDGNPTKLKTKNGIKRFINTWLSRAQDQGGGRQGVYQQPSNPFGLDRRANRTPKPFGGGIVV